jgi:DNA repair photolyase
MADREDVSEVPGVVPAATAGAPRGRAARSNPRNRFEALAREACDDGWWSAIPGEDETLPTELIADRSKTVIARNDSPDVPFSQSINPYRGCEHGCIYCFARPSHVYLGYSAGLDFETRIVYKPDVAERLHEELASPRYRCEPIALGTNTDCYQPVERRLRLTRGILEVLCEARHPVQIATKSPMILRDLDLLADLARDGLAQVMVSVTTLDRELARRMEPRAAMPERRLEAIRELSRAGVPTGVLFSPLIPALNDHEMERVLEAAREAGALRAATLLLRLPSELAEMFPAWLDAHYPGRARHVMSLIRQLRGGRDNDPRFHHRMRGEGPFADLIEQRFRAACRRCGLDAAQPALDCTRFRRPPVGGQLTLL